MAAGLLFVCWKRVLHFEKWSRWIWLKYQGAMKGLFFSSKHKLPYIFASNNIIKDYDMKTEGTERTTRL